MQKAPDGKRIFVWRGQDDDTSRLTAAIAEATATRLFNVNGALVWLKDGQGVVVSRNTLFEIITTLVCSVRLAQHGDGYEVEYFSFGFPPRADTSMEPDDRVLNGLAESLLLLVAKGPRAAPNLSEQTQFEIRQRVRMGENEERVASFYKVDVGTVRQVAKAG